MTENSEILHLSFSISDFHFSIISLEGEVISPYWHGLAWTLINFSDTGIIRHGVVGVPSIAV